MRKVLILEMDRIQGDAVFRIQTGGDGPKEGEPVRVWLDDDRFRDGEVTKVYFSDGLFFDAGKLGDVKTVKDLKVDVREANSAPNSFQAQLSGIRTKESALAWGRKQAERLLVDGAVYWFKRAERVYFVEA